MLQSRAAAVRAGAAGALMNCSAQCIRLLWDIILMYAIAAEVRQEIRELNGLAPLVRLMSLAIGNDTENSCALAAGALQNCAQDRM